MWYFAWILGLGLAATVGILNALWYELRTVREKDQAVEGRTDMPRQRADFRF